MKPYKPFLHTVQKIREYFCYFSSYANLKLKEHLVEADKSCLHSFVAFFLENENVAIQITIRIFPNSNMYLSQSSNVFVANVSSGLCCFVISSAKGS